MFWKDKEVFNPDKDRDVFLKIWTIKQRFNIKRKMGDNGGGMAVLERRNEVF